MQNNWWHNKIVYQIYPQSFYDSNNDGIGDLRGIIKKLDYLKDLGIDIIWICPIFSSPMIDNGYDISDYYSIAPQYGNLDDLKKLIDEADKRKIKILLDLVVNHCSDQHEWFKKALENPKSEYANFFIIEKGINGKKPNNWRAIFGGSVWEKIPNSDYYYYHTFSKHQPDFNWENKELRYKIYEMINYWLELGIGGFRIDAITFIKKDLTFQSLPADRTDGLVALRTVGINYPGIEIFIKEMKKVTFEKYNAFSVAEMSGVKPENLNLYIGQQGLYDSIFDFSVMNLDLRNSSQWYKYKRFTAQEINNVLYKNQKKALDINAYLSIVLENHDQPRALNKWFKKNEISFFSASLLAVFNLTLRGIPFLYQGQEIGMTNRNWSNMEEIKDVKSIAQYKAALLDGVSPEEAFKSITYRTRDNARSPMYWDNTVHAGFTKGIPWTKVNENYKEINVKKQKADKNSLLHFYKKLIKIRKSEKYKDVLWQGSIKQLFENNQYIIAFERKYKNRTLHIILNYSNQEVKQVYPYYIKKCLLNNYKKLDFHKGVLTLKPFEAVIFNCDAKE